MIKLLILIAVICVCVWIYNSGKFIMNVWFLIPAVAVVVIGLLWQFILAAVIILAIVYFILYLTIGRKAIEEKRLKEEQEKRDVEAVAEYERCKEEEYQRLLAEYEKENGPLE